MNVPNRGARPSSLALVNQAQPVQQTAVMPALNPSVGSPSVVAGYPRLNMVPEVPSVALFKNNICNHGTGFRTTGQLRIHISMRTMLARKKWRTIPQSQCLFGSQYS